MIRSATNSVKEELVNENTGELLAYLRFNHSSDNYFLVVIS